MTTESDTLSTEVYRHQCEVRQVLKWRVEDRTKALLFLTGVREKRKGGADRLVNDVMKQWALGNRGQDGDWKDETQEA